MTNATITLDGNSYDLPVVVGTEGEVGVDTSKFRAQSKAIMLDPGYGNTGSCKSAITFINGEEGVLRYRGYPIEELAEKTTFEEVMYLLVWGELPNDEQLASFNAKLAEHGTVPDGIKNLLDSMPEDIHPMAATAAATMTLSGYYPWEEDHDEDIIRLIAKFKAIVAYVHLRKLGKDYVAPSGDKTYVEDFVSMMFGKESDTLTEAINKLLILHADHEQNCSASTVRMVGSSHANLYASISAGISALWGPLHGGANQAVIEMLEQIQEDGGDVEKYVALAKDKSSDFRLMGFGHRVYKNFDPRAKIIKKAADEVLDALGVDDPALDIAKQLEKAALEDEYFVARKLYPNVDFYSGIIYRALGIPTDMFTVMFAIGRLPGWIAQWKEWRDDQKARIHRPRQIYVGENKRSVEG
jgi:citrate synthase